MSNIPQGDKLNSLLERIFTSRWIMVFAIGSILAGNLFDYFFWYRYNHLLYGIGAILIFAGFLSIIFRSIFSFKGNKQNQPSANNKKFIGTKWLLLLIASPTLNLLLLQKASGWRVDYLLRHEPTTHTTAVIKKIDIEMTRTGAEHWVIFSYNVGGATITQEIDTKHYWAYTEGGKVDIVYSNKYPEMVRILTQ